jgi:hypothetical protein
LCVRIVTIQFKQYGRCAWPLVNVMLATFCYDFDLTGRSVWLTLIVGITGALATAGFRVPTEAVQRRLVVLLPVLMLGLCMATRSARSHDLFGFFYKCYEAQLDAAFTISFAFAVGFTIAALRARHRFSRTCGVVCAACCVWFFSEAVRYIERMHHWYEPVGS